MLNAWTAAKVTEIVIVKISFMKVKMANLTQIQIQDSISTM